VRNSVHYKQFIAVAATQACPASFFRIDLSENIYIFMTGLFRQRSEKRS